MKTAEGERPFFEFEDYDRLLEAARSIDADTHLLCLLGGDAGLRAGEILALEQADVDHRRGALLIQRAEYRGVVSLPKGGKPRRVPMTQKLAAALKSHRHLRGKRVFNDVTYKVLTGWLAAAEERAVLERTGNLHKLRHTFCSHLAMRGAPAKSIQRLAGHVDLATTLKYMHLSPNATDQAIRLLDGEMLEKGSSGLKKSLKLRGDAGSGSRTRTYETAKS